MFALLTILTTLICGMSLFSVAWTFRAIQLEGGVPKKASTETGRKGVGVRSTSPA